MLLLAVLACTSGVDDSATVDDTSAKGVTSLTISSEFDFTLINNNSLSLAQALSGETVTVHIGDHYTEESRVSESTAGGGRTQYWVGVNAAPVGTPDGDVWITYDGLESNHIPYYAAAWIDSMTPETLTPGVSTTLTGGNFGTNPVVGGGVGGVVDGVTDTEIVFRPGPALGTNVQVNISKTLPGGGVVGNETGFLEPEIVPVVFASCAATSEEVCAIKGGAFDNAVNFGLGALTVGGVEVTDFDGLSGWSSTEVRFYIPDSVPVGTHEAVLTNNDGHSVSFEVTKLGWLRQELGLLARFDEAGGTLEAEGTSWPYADRLGLWNAGVTVTPGTSNLYGTGPTLSALGDLNTPPVPPTAWTPRAFPLAAAVGVRDVDCGTPRIGQFMNSALFAWAGGGALTDDPVVSGRQCAAGDRVVNVDATDLTTGVNVERIEVPSGWAVPGGIVHPAERALVLVVDWVEAKTTVWMAANNPILVADYGISIDSRGTGYDAGDEWFYLAGGEPGWDGRIYEVHVEQGVNQGAFPTLTPVEIGLPFATTDPAEDRFVAFSGTPDGELVALAVEDDGSQQLYAWNPVSDDWSPWVMAPTGEIADVAVHDGVPYVLLYETSRSGLVVMGWDDTGSEWVQMGEELAGWWARWEVCEGPYADSGPTGGQGDCTLEEIPRQQKTWRERPADAGRARLQAHEGYGLVATYDAWVTDDVYDGDLGDDRQYVAVWKN